VRRRGPAVAGQFYEADPELLRKRIEWAFLHELGPGQIPKVSGSRIRESIGYVVPHAGYVYSGPVAAHAYLNIASEGMPETVIILAPNHTGYGSAVAVYPEGVWITPLGEIKVDEELAEEVVNNSVFAKLDAGAHEYEHSIEVQLPFLQYLFGDGIRIVPISMMYQTPEAAKDMADAISAALESVKRDVIVIASSDMTHYEPHELAVKKDKLALEAILELNAEKLYRVIMNNDISMCGYGPVMTLINYARHVGAKGAELLKYATSGDVSGEKSWVVGYAAVRVYGAS